MSRKPKFIVRGMLNGEKFLIVNNGGPGWVPNPKHAAKFGSRYSAKLEARRLNVVGFVIQKLYDATGEQDGKADAR